MTSLQDVAEEALLMPSVPARSLVMDAISVTASTAFTRFVFLWLAAAQMGFVICLFVFS
jgi:hypothetical protein